MYSTLIDVGGVRQLLGLDSRSAHLESFLRSTGGLDGATAGSPLPPLQPEQVTDVLGQGHVVTRLGAKYGHSSGSWHVVALMFNMALAWRQPV